MGFATGTFSLDGSNPVVTGQTISSTWANDTLSDIATNGLTLCLLKNGTQTVTANIPFAGFRLTGIGAPTAANDALREGSAIGATSAAAGTFTTLTLSGAAVGAVSQNVFNTVSTTINAFGAATTMAIGAAASATTWTGQSFSLTGANSTNNTALTIQNTSNAAAASHAYLDIAVGGITSTGDPHTRWTIPSGTSWYAGVDNSDSDLFKIGTGTAVGTNGVLTLAAASVSPSTTDGVSLGTTALMFSDLYLASGGIVNFDNGNYTATHSAGLLTLSNAVTITTGTLTLASTIVSSGTTANVFNTTATTVNAFGAASTALNIGHASGTNAVLGATTFSQAVTLSSTINKLTLTAPATSATLTIADGKTATISSTVTLTATDGSTLAIGTGGTLAGMAYQSGSWASPGAAIGTGTPVAGTFTSISGIAYSDFHSVGITGVLAANHTSALVFDQNTSSTARIIAYGPDTSTPGSVSIFGVSSNGSVYNTLATFTGTGAVTIPGTLGVTGMTYINDTSNANMTTGLTINQGAADNEILALKSSDVAHGITLAAETDTYGRIAKIDATNGGAECLGLSAGTIGFSALGYHVTDDTAKSTIANGALVLLGALKSGTGVTALGANANILVIKNNTATAFIFDAEGSAHADVEWIAFDHHDDIALLNGLNAEMLSRKGVVQANFGEWVRDSREALQREGIFNFYDDGPRAMMNMTKMHMLTAGAIRQLGRELAQEREHRIALENKLLS